MVPLAAPEMRLRKSATSSSIPPSLRNGGARLMMLLDRGSDRPGLFKLMAARSFRSPRRIAHENNRRLITRDGPLFSDSDHAQSAPLQLPLVPYARRRPSASSTLCHKLSESVGRLRRAPPPSQSQDRADDSSVPCFCDEALKGSSPIAACEARPSRELQRADRSCSVASRSRTPLASVTTA